MADEKIRISWEDVHSAAVDERLKQQSAVDRAQQHYQEAGPAGGAPAATAYKSSILYNTVFYMALFGLIGGFIAWVGGEVVDLLIPDHVQIEAQEFLIVEGMAKDIAERRNRGEITEAVAERELKQLFEQRKSNPFVAIFSNDSLSDDEKAKQFHQRLTKEGWRMFVQNLFWFSVVAISIGFFLSIADQAVGRNLRGVIVSGSIGLVLAMIGGIVVGLFINQLYTAMGGGQTEQIGKQVVARSIGWAILGLFLAIAPGLVLMNWKRSLIGLVGGFLGGLIGGLLFDLVGSITGSAVVSRFIGIVSIGLIAGVGTGLIEAAAKTGWLKVVAGLIAGKQFILYKNPTFIGSSPQCEIYLFKDPQIAPRHAALHRVAGGFDLEDLQGGSGTFVNGRAVSRTRLRNNDQVQIGSTVFSFQEKRSAS
jgi:hypothetical protein